MAKRSSSKRPAASCKGWVPKAAGTELDIAINGPRKIYPLKIDALLAKKAGEVVVQVEIREL